MPVDPILEKTGYEVFRGLIYTSIIIEVSRALFYEKIKCDLIFGNA